MIGKLTVPIKNTQNVVTLILHDNGFIECDEPLLKEIAETSLLLYNRNYSAADGTYGYGFLNELARDLDGRAEFEQKKPFPPETIF